jgi:hypothetical protein
MLLPDIERLTVTPPADTTAVDLDYPSASEVFHAAILGRKPTCDLQLQEFAALMADTDMCFADVAA